MTQLDFSGYFTEKTIGFTGRKWVFDELDSLLVGENKSHFYHIGGGPGSGKSAVAARLAQISLGKVETENYLCLRKGFLSYFHFCQASFDPTLDPLDFVRFLSLSLCAYDGFANALLELNDPNIHIDVDQTIEKVEEGGNIQGVVIQELLIGNLAPRLAWNQLVRRPLEKLYSMGHSNPIIILVDSLDEALTIDSENNIVVLLKQVAHKPEALPTQVKFILTGRFQDPTLRGLFGDPHLDLIANAPPDSKDIYNYGFNVLVEKPEPQRSILAQKVDRASDGNFLYARYVLNDLLKQSDLPEDLDTLRLPEGLEGVYKEFLERKITKNPDKWANLYRPLLGLLSVARIPGIRRDHLADISGLPPSQVDNFIKACSQYLVGDMPDGPFDIYHQSFREFILSNERFQVFPDEAEEKLGKFLLNTYGNIWRECNDAYALLNTPSHLTRAALAQNRPPLQLKRQDLLGTLEKLLMDYSFLVSRLRVMSIYTVLTEIRNTIRLFPEMSSTTSQLALLLRALDLEANNLRDWNSEVQPAFLAQQVLNQSKRQPELLALTEWASAGLNLSGKPFFELQWSTRREPGVLARILTGHQANISALKTTPDGRYVIAGCEDGNIHLWDVQTGEYLRAINGSSEYETELDSWRSTERGARFNYSNSITSLALTPDHKAIIASFQSDGHNQGGVGIYSIFDNEQFVLPIIGLGREIRAGIYKGERFSNFVGFQIPVTALAVAPDGRWLAAVFVGKQLTVWDLKSGIEIFSIKSDRWITTISITEKNLLIALLDESGAFLGIWEISEFLRNPYLLYEQDRLKILLHQEAITELSSSADGSLIVSASADGTLKIWGMVQNEELGVIQDWSIDDAKKLLDRFDFRSGSYGRENPSRSWAAYLRSRNVLSSLRGDVHYDIPWHCVSITSDNRYVISGLWNGNIHLWDLQSQQLIRQITAHRGAVRALAGTADGRYAVSAGDDGTLKVWDLRGRPESGMDLGHRAWVNALTFTPDRKRLVSGADNGEIKVWDIDRREAISSWPAHEGWVLDFAFTPDGMRLISAGGDKLIKIWDLKTGKQVQKLEGHHDRVTGLYMTSEGELISASADCSLVLWDLENDKQVRTFSGHSDWVIRVKGIPGTRRIISTSKDTTLKIWDLDSGKEIHTFIGHDAQVDGVAVTSDGHFAVSASYDSTLRIWDLKDFQFLRELKGHRGVVQKVIISTDNQLIFSVSLDRTLRAWNFSSGKEIASVALAAELGAIALHPEGKSIAVADASGNVLLLQLKYLYQ